MPRKTLALILGLVLVTVILFIIALQTAPTSQQGKQTKTAVSPTPDVVHTTLAMSPNPVEVASGGQGSVDVMIDPTDNPVTAVQLELLYDPTMVSNVKVTSGPLFTNGVVLINKNNPQTGRVTYAVGITPSQKPLTAKGVVATVTFTARGTVGKQSQIIMQEQSLVTARGVATSVLKSGTGTTVVIGSAGTVTTPVVTTVPTQ